MMLPSQQIFGRDACRRCGIHINPGEGGARFVRDRKTGELMRQHLVCPQINGVCPWNPSGLYIATRNDEVQPDPTVVQLNPFRLRLVQKEQ